MWTAFSYNKLHNHPWAVSTKIELAGGILSLFLFFILKNFIEKQPLLAHLSTVAPLLQISCGGIPDTSGLLKISFKFVLQLLRHGVEWRVDAKISHVTLSSVSGERRRFMQFREWVCLKRSFFVRQMSSTCCLTASAIWGASRKWLFGRTKFQKYRKYQNTRYTERFQLN